MRHAESTPNLPQYAAPFAEPPGYHVSQQSAYLSVPQHLQERTYVHRDAGQPTFAPKPKFDSRVAEQVTFQLQEAKHNRSQNQGNVPTQQQQRDKGTELYKTELCRKWITTGTCRYGTKCQFAHGVGELRKLVRHPLYKTSMCKSYQATGICRYGSRCRFIHDETEQELSGLTRSNSTNNVAFLSNGAMTSMSPNSSTARTLNGPSPIAFPRVPSAPENLNNHMPQRSGFSNGGLGLNGTVMNGWTQTPVERSHPAAIPKNYSHGHFSVEGFPGQTTTGPYQPRRNHVAPQPARAISSSFSAHDLTYQPRARTHHSFSEDQGLFATHDIAISSSTNSSYSSAASSGEQLGGFPGFHLEQVESEEDVHQVATDVAQRLLKSQSQPALANMSAPSIPKRIGGEKGLELEEVAQHFESFHIADLSEPVQSGGKSGRKLEHPENGRENGESRLDFFRSISNVDLASMDKGNGAIPNSAAAGRVQ